MISKNDELRAHFRADTGTFGASKVKNTPFRPRSLPEGQWAKSNLSVS
jgi:hypothetical protein